MRFLSTVLLITLSFSISYAQTVQGTPFGDGYEVTPLGSNYILQNYKPKLSLRGAPDSINLPFVEDFSYAGPYPDPDLWLDNNVFINNTMGFNAPSVGVASFDGINSKGRPYGGVGEIDTADFLTSNYINLKDFINPDGSKRDLTIADNILMSFFLQPKGLAYAPTEVDSLVLQFRDASGNWNFIKAYKGIPNAQLNKNPLDTVPPFVYYTVPINEAKYLYGKFQFRFFNVVNVGGAYEFFHLDYIKIAANRLVANKNLDDLAFVEPPKPILKRYTSMPWKHAQPQLATEIRDTFSAKFYNHFTTQRNPTNTNLKVTASNGTVAVSNFTILDGINIPPSVFYTSVAKNYPASLKQQLATIPATTEKLQITSEYSLTIEGQEGKDLKKAASRNDMTTSTTVFDNYFAYDDGTAEMQFSATGDGMQIAVRYRANVADSLRGVMFFFPHINGDAPKDATFNIKIWKDSLKLNPIFQMKNVKPFYLTTLADTLQGFSSYKTVDTLGRPIPIPAGDFYIGWQNVGDVKIPIGLDRNNQDKTQYLYQYLSGAWEQVSAVRKIGAVMVRPVLGNQPVRNSSTLKVNEIPLSEVMTISPNPTTDRLYFDVKKGLSEDYEMSVFNLTGQLQKREILRGSEMLLNNFDSGVYFLKIRNLKNNQIFNHKFVVNK